MKSFKKIVLITIAALSISATNPVDNKYDLSKGYTVTILGTSNLHNWTENVGTVTGYCNVGWNTDKTFNLGKLYLSMEVSSIKSTEGGIMNRNTYKALKADIHPEIIFSINTPIQSIKAESIENNISVQGFLSIAGVTNPITMQVKVSMEGTGNLTFEGSQAIKMTDYGVTPPKALFGTLKTGNEITISFKTKFTTTN
jgi:polyisoprenoid-binding protein YceI